MEAEKMRINYHNGHFFVRDIWHLTWSGGVVTAPQLQQGLDQSYDVLKPIKGDYNWSIEGDKGKWEVVARWKGQKWIDGRGKTPRDAMKDFLRWCKPEGFKY